MITINTSGRITDRHGFARTVAEVEVSVSSLEDIETTLVSLSEAYQEARKSLLLLKTGREES